MLDVSSVVIFPRKATGLVRELSLVPLRLPYRMHGCNSFFEYITQTIDYNIIRTTDYIQNIRHSSTFWQLSKMLQNASDWTFNFNERFWLREWRATLYRLKFWILSQRKHWLPRLLDFTKTLHTDKNADSMYKFQNLRVPPPSSQIFIHAQHSTLHISSVFGRKTGDTKKSIFPNEGGIKNCRKKSKTLLKKFYTICLELHLNLQNRLKKPCVSSFACLKITLNSLKKAFLSLFKHYTVPKKVMLVMRSKIWYYCSSSSNANKRRTISIHKILGNQGDFF